LESCNQLLAAAMIELAIADWKAGIGRPEWSQRGRRSMNAADWLFNPERRALVTFEDACAALGADPDYTRKEIVGLE
jgi:hypothetical protein